MFLLFTTSHQSIFVFRRSSSFQCPLLNSSRCMNKNNHAECQSFVKNRCRRISMMESCPLQFACQDLFYFHHDRERRNTGYVCPLPNAPCMNQDNYQQCIKLQNDGCQDIAPSEVCPMTFECGDVIDPQYDACVTVSIYTNCSSKTKQLLRNVTIPTWSQPGNVDFCYNNATLFPNRSMNQQYCSPDNGFYYDILYLHSNTCQANSILPPQHRQSSLFLTLASFFFTEGRCRRWYTLFDIQLGVCKRLYNASPGNTDDLSIIPRIMSSGNTCFDGIFVECKFGTDCPPLTSY